MGVSRREPLRSRDDRLSFGFANCCGVGSLGREDDGGGVFAGAVLVPVFTRVGPSLLAAAVVTGVTRYGKVGSIGRLLLGSETFLVVLAAVLEGL